MSKICDMEWSLNRFLNELGSKRPAPGGGSAAAVAGSLGVELGSKVCRILLARRNLSPKSKAELKRSLKTLGQLSRELRRSIREDSQAYLGLLQALKTGRGISSARRQATEAPLCICDGASKGRQLLRRLGVFAGPSLGSDLKAGEALLRGGL